MLHRVIVKSRSVISFYIRYIKTMLVHTSYISNPSFITLLFSPLSRFAIFQTKTFVNSFFPPLYFFPEFRATFVQLFAQTCVISRRRVHILQAPLAEQKRQPHFLTGLCMYVHGQTNKMPAGWVFFTSTRRATYAMTNEIFLTPRGTVYMHALSVPVATF